MENIFMDSMNVMLIIQKENIQSLYTQFQMEHSMGELYIIKQLQQFLVMIFIIIMQSILIRN